LARHASGGLPELGEPTIQGCAGILEREAELSPLDDAIQAAAAGDGSVVLVFGEAGIGKSSLVEAVRARLPAEGRMFVGYCDDLATPRTLGPFRDAHQVRPHGGRAGRPPSRPQGGRAGRPPSRPQGGRPR